MMKRFLLVLTSLMLLVPLAGAQEATPSPAPSKTPEPALTPADAPVAVAEINEAYALDEPFNQSDLSVLVGNVQRPNGFVLFEDNLYAACNGDWTLYEIDSRTGSTITFVFGVRDAHELFAEATDAGFNLWIPDYELNQFTRVDQSRGAPVAIAQASDGLDGPWGIEQLDADLFLVSNLRAGNLVTIDRAGSVSEVMSGLRAPAGLALGHDADGNAEFVYVVNNGSARRAIEWLPVSAIRAEDPTNTDAIQPLVSGLQNASNLELADDGYLYFTYALGTRGVVGRVNPAQCREAGGCSNDEVEIVLYTELNAPLSGLTITPDFRLFVHTIYRPELYWVSLYD